MKLPSRATFLHLRFGFSFLLLPVFVFALSQARVIHLPEAILVFICWHFFVYPASNGYNSYFDKDKGSIALMEKPPAVDISLYYTSLFFEVAGILIALLVSFEFAVSVFIYGLLSKMYSHPLIRLKRHPLISFLIVFFFQGAFVYWSSFAAITDLSFYVHFGLNPAFREAGLICSFLIGASYPLTQVYQHKEDRERGDRTLSMVLGINGSFWFSAFMFCVAIFLMGNYWDETDRPENYYIFIGCIIPVAVVFVSWFATVLQDKGQASFRNMTRMTFVSAAMMLLYFMIIWVKA